MSLADTITVTEALKRTAGSYEHLTRNLELFDKNVLNDMKHLYDSQEVLIEQVKNLEKALTVTPKRNAKMFVICVAVGFVAGVNLQRRHAERKFEETLNQTAQDIVHDIRQSL